MNRIKKITFFVGKCDANNNLHVVHRFSSWCYPEHFDVLEKYYAPRGLVVAVSKVQDTV